MGDRISKPQLDLLCRASAHEGKISTFGTSSLTLKSLRAAGYIKEDLAIRDDAMRGKFLDGQRPMTAMAAKQLEAGDWQGALSSLRSAEDAQKQLDQKADWITEAGRAVVEETP